MIGRTSIKCHLIDLASPMPDASTRIKNTSLYIDMAITQSRNDPHFKRFDAIRTSEKCIIQVSSDPVSILTSPNTEQQLLMQTLFCELQLLHPPNMQSNLYSVSVHASGIRSEEEICFVCNRVRFSPLSSYLCFFSVISCH